MSRSLVVGRRVRTSVSQAWGSMPLALAVAIRLMMAAAESIRDVIAFPKTQRAQCLLTDAPGPVDEKQLRELHIRLRNPQPAH